MYIYIYILWCHARRLFLNSKRSVQRISIVLFSVLSRFCVETLGHAPPLASSKSCLIDGLFDTFFDLPGSFLDRNKTKPPNRHFRLEHGQLFYFPTVQNVVRA